ncbi:isoprenylcysteine carboxylmethyltransferase family protein [Staphylococcus kloosii]|uniref:isoprenylcysteine carboxylmethyltransferase family protein n=1 Tax=Staphylococcus kloosii TaxID=29384 RepID=UPI0018A03049|nr:isoprenylcysteine carboxylmethyltransferase family protein [Staphylococcus kloosii]MBF7030188.1 hypothetical protein [Staphylococcus kloosii]
MTFTILLLFFIVRLYSLKISIKHTQQLIQKGAKEYGAQNSKYLALNHILIYVGAAVEALINKDAFSLFNGLGLVLLIAGYAVLFHVIKALGLIWTLKLFILPEHPIVKSGLYKITKHPNVPELIGVILLTHATYTSVLLIPYAYFLHTRIVQEEKMMNL